MYKKTKAMSEEEARVQRERQDKYAAEQAASLKEFLDNYHNNPLGTLESIVLDFVARTSVNGDFDGFEYGTFEPAFSRYIPAIRLLFDIQQALYEQNKQ